MSRTPQNLASRGWDAGRAFARAGRAEWVLAAVAAALYLLAINWGLPSASHQDVIRTWATDSITPLGPLSELHNTLIETKADRYVAYPLLHYLLLAAVYSPYLLYLFLTGQFAHPGGQYPYGFADPVAALRVLELLARAVSVSMAAGIVVAAYRTARCLWGQSAAGLAGVFTMLMHPMFYYSRTGNLDVPVLFWTSLGVMFYAEIIERGLNVKRAAWLGACAALATATKDQGWGAFALMPPVLLALQLRRSRAAGARLEWRPLVAGAVTCLLVYAVGSGFVFNPERYFAHLAWIREHVPFPQQQHFPATPAGYAALTAQTLGHVADATGPLMLFAACAGLVVLWRRERTKLAICAPALGHFVFVIMLARLSTLRYVMPIAFVVCLLAARGVAAGFEWGRVHRRVAAAAAAVICVWLLLLGLDLTYQMRNDSRQGAAPWLDERMRPGESVGHVISASYLPRLKPGSEYYWIAPDGAAAQKIASGRPRFIVIMPDWTSAEGSAYPAGFPKETYDKLLDGSLSYHLAARFKTESLFERRLLDYPTVNPPLEIFERADR